MKDRTIRLLLVEDEAGFAYLLRAVLTNLPSSPFIIDHARSLAEATSFLAAQPHDVVLLDLTLPDRSGLDTYTDVQKAASGMPIIVLTGSDDEALALRAVHEGAQDYLVKGQVDGKMLTRVIRYAIERKSTELQIVRAERLEAISTFAAGVAHEVKNPLQTLTLGLDYLTGQCGENAQTKAVLGDMDQAIQRADAIIRGLVEFSGIRPKCAADEDLNKVIAGAFRAVDSELANYPIQVEKSFDDKLPLVHLDARTMKHVFIHLFMTSINAMTGGGTLQVKTFQARLESNLKPRTPSLQPGDPMVVVEINDTGASTFEQSPGSAFSPQPGAPVRPGSASAFAVIKKVVELYRGIVEIHPVMPTGIQIRLVFKPVLPNL